MFTNIERRHHPRMSVNLLVQYRFDTFDAFVAEYAHDMSEGGLLIKDPEIVRPEGTHRVSCSSCCANGTKLIEGLSRSGAHWRKSPDRVDGRASCRLR